MKKILLASAVVLVAVVGGGGWYVLANRDPLQQAKVLLNKGDFNGANLQLRNAVRDQPNSAEAHALLAQLRLAGGDPVAAEYEIKRAMALHWDQPSSLALLTQAYMRQAKWKEILTEIPDQGTGAEQTAYFLMTRAVAQRGLNDNAKADATLAEAARLAPQNAEVHLVAARFAAGDKQIDKALDEVNRSLALEPARADALQVKAGLLSAKGDRDGALAEMNRAIEAAPSRTDLLIERAGLLLAGGGQDDEALADIETALKRDPKSYPALYVNTVLLIRQNKFTDADLLLQRLDPVLAQFQRGLYFKAMVKSRLNQNGQAEDAIISYVNKYPTDPDGVRLLAAIEMATNHASRAIPYLVKAVSAGQRDAETLDLLGRAYVMDGKKTEAEQVFQQAAQTATTPQQLARLASARLQVGDLSGAAADLQRSVDAGPAQPGTGEALVATAIRLGQLDRAQEALDRLRQQAGETEAVGNLTGLLKLARLDQQGALSAFEDTAKRFPDSIGARLNQAKVLLQLNRTNDALSVLQAVLDKNPAQADALTLLVQALLSQGRNDDALAAADRARRAQPTDLGLINGQAQILARLKRYDKALEVLNSAKVNEKLPTQLLPTQGGVQLAAGQNDAAKRTFADLVAAEPNNVGAILTDVELLTRLKDFDAARQVLDDSLKRQPANLPLLQARVRTDLLEKGPDSALQTADRLRADPANMPGSTTLKGGLLMGAQRFTEAAAAFQTEFDQEPTSALAVALAEARQASGDAAGAQTVLRNWQAQHADDPTTAQALGMIELTNRNYPGAERNLQIVLNQQPGNVIALNNMAWVLQQKGDKRAREFAQRAFEQSPTPEVADTLAWIMTTQGEAAKALPLLQSAATAAPQNPSIKYHLAVALKDVNRQQEAIDVLRPVAEGSASFEEKPAAQSLLAELTKSKP